MPLKLIKRKDTWHVTGTVGAQRIRRSLGTGDKGQAEEARAQLEARLWQGHLYGDEAVRTFEEAALGYLKQGGEGRFLPKLIRHFRGRPVSKIHPGEVRDAALALYPGAQAATRNRQAIIPARAVINYAASKGWCAALRVQLFPVPKPRKHQPVDRAWLDAFMAQADADGLPHLSTAVLFMHQTAARRGEAVSLMGEHVDLHLRIAVLAKTKTEEWVVRHLTAELVVRIAALAPAAGKPVFGYTNGPAVNRRMMAVCARAKIPYRSPHSAGRHSFGTTAMSEGIMVKDAMDAGGWKSARLFLETYVHSADAGRKVAARFDALTGPIGTSAYKRKRYRFGKRST